MRRLALVALLPIELVIGACSQTSGTVMGVVIDVNGNLEEVRSFTLLVEGEEMTFVAVSDGDYAYPLSHLRDHLRDGAPVRVGWEKRDDELVALSLDDG